MRYAEFITHEFSTPPPPTTSFLFARVCEGGGGKCRKSEEWEKNKAKAKAKAKRKIRDVIDACVYVYRTTCIYEFYTCMYDLYFVF